MPANRDGAKERKVRVLVTVPSYAKESQLEDVARRIAEHVYVSISTEATVELLPRWDTNGSFVVGSHEYRRVDPVDVTFRPNTTPFPAIEP